MTNAPDDEPDSGELAYMRTRAPCEGSASLTTDGVVWIELDGATFAMPLEVLMRYHEDGFALDCVGEPFEEGRWTTAAVTSAFAKVVASEEVQEALQSTERTDPPPTH